MNATDMNATFRKTFTLQVEVTVEFQVDTMNAEDCFIDAWTCESDCDAAIDAAIEAMVDCGRFEQETAEAARRQYAQEARLARIEAACEADGVAA